MTRAPLVPRFAVPLPPGTWSGRAGEFLLLGGGTLLLLPLSWGLRRAAGLDGPELAVGFLMFHAAHVINDPHFAVTYLLFYKNFRERAFGDALPRAARMRYRAAGILAPLGLAVWALLALAGRSAHALGLLIQLMFLLVGWHYVKQGFGVFAVMSARRGLRFDPLERWAFLAHCLAGWAYAWASPADPGTEVEEKGVVYNSLAHPRWLEHATGAAFALTVVPLTWALLRVWRREGRFVPLAPLTGMLCSVWLWSIYSSFDPLLVYIIPALHSVQYLYMVGLLKKNEAREREGPPHFGLPVSVRLGLLVASALFLGWVLFHAAPSVLDALAPLRPPDPAAALGATPWFAAVFTFVNIHHYAMDHAIWRRENPDTGYLYR